MIKSMLTQISGTSGVVATISPGTYAIPPPALLERINSDQRKAFLLPARILSRAVNKKLPFIVVMYHNPATPMASRPPLPDELLLDDTWSFDRVELG